MDKAGIGSTIVSLTQREVGSDRVMFSVDYPYESMQEAADWFDNCPISDNDLVKIGRANAAQLFNIL
jgi:predicted TIM-barrel fold metal-dependent hydrolase